VHGDVRDLFPSLSRVTYLNTGALGPISAPVADAVLDDARRELHEGRGLPGHIEELRGLTASARAALGAHVGAPACEIACTGSTAEGMNVVLSGLGLGAGDRVVTTSLEHRAALLPLYRLRLRDGVELAFADVGDGAADQALSAVEAALRTPARLLVLSHVTWSTGAVLPVAEIAALAHAAGTPVLVDGAQAVGAMPVDAAALGADFYAFSGQKWLCGPEGTGGLRVDPSWWTALEPVRVGPHGADLAVYRPNDPSSYALAPDAERYHVAAPYRPALRGLARAAELVLAWNEGGALHARTHALAARCRLAAADLPGVTVLTPAERHAGLVCLRLSGEEPARCVARLRGHGVIVREVPDNGALRISCAFFNTEEEVDRAVRLVGARP